MHQTLSFPVPGNDMPVLLVLGTMLFGVRRPAMKITGHTQHACTRSVCRVFNPQLFQAMLELLSGVCKEFARKVRVCQVSPGFAVRQWPKPVIACISSIHLQLREGEWPADDKHTACGGSVAIAPTRRPTRFPNTHANRFLFRAPTLAPPFAESSTCGCEPARRGSAMPCNTLRGAAAQLLVVLVLLDSTQWRSVAAEHDTAAPHRAQRSARSAAGETETYLLVYDVRHDA